jgi:Flp pilus assembly protein TadG
MLPIIRIFKTRREGQALIEFALVFPILMLLLCGIFEFGFIALKSSSVSGIAREAARTGAVTSPFDAVLVRTTAQTLLTNAGFKTEDIISPIGVINPTAADPTITVTVQVNYRFITGTFLTTLIPIFPSGLILTGRTVMRWEG